MSTPPHIVVAGPIGAGKSTVTIALARRLGLNAELEDPDANPFLARFYSTRGAWTLQSEAWFLADEIRHHIQTSTSPDGGIQDNSWYETITVFIPAQVEFGFLSCTDATRLTRVAEALTARLPPPTLLVSLSASLEAQVERIRTRNRPYEAALSIDYLRRLDQLCADFVQSWTLSPIVHIDTERFDMRVADEARAVAAFVCAQLP